MKTAKITGPATYHRCIKDLNEYGCISCELDLGEKALSERPALRLQSKTALK